MNEIYNERGVSNSDKFHQYPFELPDIVDLEYERAHGGKSLQHVESCICIECKNPVAVVKRAMTTSKSTPAITHPEKQESKFDRK